MKITLTKTEQENTLVALNFYVNDLTHNDGYGVGLPEGAEKRILTRVINKLKGVQTNVEKF